MTVEATTFQALGRPVSSSMSVSYRCTSSQRAESVGARVRWMVAWSFCGLTVMGTSMMEKSSRPGTVSRTRAVTASRVDCCGRRARMAGRNVPFSAGLLLPRSGRLPGVAHGRLEKVPRVQVWSRWTSLSCSHTRSKPRATGRATCRTQADTGVALLLRHTDGVAAEKLGQQQARLLDAPGLPRHRKRPG